MRQLSPEAAARKFPVKVQGQVLWVHPTGNGFFAHEDGEGIYVHKPLAGGELSRFSAGDVVRVEGVSNEGYFSPSIFAETITFIRKAPLPESRPFHAFEKYSATIDCDWVWLAGRIVAKHVQKGTGDVISLEIVQNSVELIVMMPFSEETDQRIEELMFSRVKFNAVAGTQYNMHRQVIGRTFFVNSADDFEVIDDHEAPGGIQIKSIDELLRKGSRHHRMPTGIHGTVTHVVGNHLYLRGEAASIKATVRGEPEVSVGDHLELEGFVLPGPISPGFAARELRVAERRKPPQPEVLELNEELRTLWDFQPDSALNHELVQVDARLVDRSISFGLATGEREHTLLCRQGTYLFEAKLPAYFILEKGIKPGATLRLTGICNLTRSQERSWRLYVDGFWLLLRGDGDIEILAAAPWWTPVRLLWVLGVLLGLAALFIIWVVLLRKTVDKQTGIIGEKIEHETVLNERQRIARELHDTLEQGLTAVSVQLRNISAKFKKDPAGGPKSVELAESMLRICREESRASIIDLRGGILEEMDLPEAIQHTLVPLVKGTPIQLHVNVRGAPVTLTLSAEHHLLRMVTEAANNAIRHGSPKNLDVKLNYNTDRLELVVRDDGTGFDPEELPAAGHFGVSGMYERANRLSGVLKISSKVGEGTTLSLSMPTSEFRKEKGRE